MAAKYIYIERGTCLPFVDIVCVETPTYGDLSKSHWLTDLLIQVAHALPPATVDLPKSIASVLISAVRYYRRRLEQISCDGRSVPAASLFHPAALTKSPFRATKLTPARPLLHLLTKSAVAMATETRQQSGSSVVT